MGAVRVSGLCVLALSSLVSVVACDEAEVGRRDAADLGGTPDSGDDAGVRDDGATSDGGDAAVSPDLGPVAPPPRPAVAAAITTRWIAEADDREAARPEVTPTALPMFVCPTGWRRETSATDPDVCEPWPASGRRDDCAPGTVHLPGTMGCEPLGATCVPGAEWPEVGAGEIARYVRAGATGGDGTMGSPVGSVGAAIMLGVSPGTVIALARGTHTVSVTIPTAATGVILRGACSGETVIAPTSVLSSAVRVEANDVVIEDLSIEGGQQGVVVETNRSATLNGVEIRSSGVEGILVRDGADLVADRIRILDAGSDGVSVRPGAIATIRHAEVTRFATNVFTNRAGLRCDGSAAVCTLEDATVRDAPNDGIAFTGASDGTLARVVVEGVSSAGIYTSVASADLSDVVVRDVRRRAGDTSTAYGVSLHASMGEMRRLRVERVADDAVLVADASRFELSDSLLRDSVVDDVSRGARVAEASRLTLARVAIHRFHDAAILAEGMSASVSGQDVSVVGGDGPQTGMLADEGVITLVRVTIEDANGPGVLARSDGSVELSEAVVRGSRASVLPGAAVYVAGAELTLNDAILEANDGPGVQLVADADGGRAEPEATLSDVAIVGGAAAHEGILVERGRLDATGVLVAGSIGRGVRVVGPGATAVLTDVAVEGVAETDGEGAIGLEARESGSIQATRVALAGVLGHGIVVDGLMSEASIDDARVEGTIAYGVVAARGGSVDGNRVEIVSAAGLGAGAFGTSQLTMHEVSVIGTTASSDGGAFGIGAFDNATVTADGFVVSGTAGCGLGVADPSSLDVMRGFVETNDVGACLGTTDYDEMRVRERVVYDGNDTDVTRDSLASPAAP